MIDFMSVMTTVNSTMGIIMLRQTLLGHAKRAVLPSTGSGTAGRLAQGPREGEAQGPQAWDCSLLS